MTDHKPTHHHMNKALSLKGLLHDLKAVNGFNAKFAVLTTNTVGTMWCAYAFALLALAGLPAALKPHGMGFVPWFAQTFLQLVLLSVIMVGQSVQSAASDSRAEKTLGDAELTLDRLNLETEGGIKALKDLLEERLPPLAPARPIEASKSVLAPAATPKKRTPRPPR